MSDSYDATTGEIIAPRMPPEIAKAIIAVKKQVKQLGSDERNEHGRYNYVSVDKFYDRIGKLMADAGLALLINEASSEVRISETTDRDGNLRKTPWVFCNYELTFMHESGVLSTLPMARSLAMPITGPQTYGAAQSYIEKQFLRQVFKIPTGEKDADDVPQDDTAAPSGGRAAQGGPGGTRSYPQRQQAAPAPSDAKAEAAKRWKEIARAIDEAQTVPDLDSLLGSLAWKACEGAIRAAETEAVADEAMHKLKDRIAARRELLLLSGERA